MAANSLGPGKLTFGAAATLREFAAHTTATFLDPSHKDGANVDFLDGSADRELDETSWVLGGNIQQQLTATGAVEDWCLQNDGKDMPFKFEPVNGGKVYEGTARIRAVKIGGDVKKKNQSDFSFPLTGAPTIRATTP